LALLAVANAGVIQPAVGPVAYSHGVVSGPALHAGPVYSAGPAIAKVHAAPVYAAAPAPVYAAAPVAKGKADA